MHAHLRPEPVCLGRRSMLALGLACGVALVSPAQAQIKGVEIIAPAGPGGGYDQLARATQQVLEKDGLASGVQVVNVPGAGGTSASPSSSPARSAATTSSSSVWA